MAARDHSRLGGDLAGWLDEAGWRRQRTWSTRETWNRSQCQVRAGIVADLFLSIHYVPVAFDGRRVTQPGLFTIGAATAEGRRLLAQHGYPLSFATSARAWPSTDEIKRELARRGWGVPGWSPPFPGQPAGPRTGPYSKLSAELDLWLHAGGWRYRDATDTFVTWIRRNAIDPEDSRRHATLLLVIEYAALQAGRILSYREPGAFGVYYLLEDGQRRLYKSWREGTDVQRTLWGQSWGPPRWQPGPQQRARNDRPGTSNWQWERDAGNVFDASGSGAEFSWGREGWGRAYNPQNPDNDLSDETREALYREIKRSLRHMTDALLRGSAPGNGIGKAAAWGGTGINWEEVNAESEAREKQRKADEEEERNFSPLVRRRIAEAEARGREQGERSGEQRAELLWSKRVASARSLGWTEGNEAGKRIGRTEAFIGHHCHAASGSVSGLSFDVLRAMVELCHPDHQPEERRTKATKITAALIPLMQAARPRR